MASRYVLLVEQDPHLSNLLDLFLHGRGFEVNVASTPAEAMRLAAARPPDVVVIGPSAPGGDLLPRQLGTLLDALAVDHREVPQIRLEGSFRPRDVAEAVRLAIRQRQTEPPLSDESSLPAA